MSDKIKVTMDVKFGVEGQEMETFTCSKEVEDSKSVLGTIKSCYKSINLKASTAANSAKKEDDTPEDKVEESSEATTDEKEETAEAKPEEPVKDKYGYTEEEHKKNKDERKELLPLKCLNSECKAEYHDYILIPVGMNLAKAECRECKKTDTLEKRKVILVSHGPHSSSRPLITEQR